MVDENSIDWQRKQFQTMMNLRNGTVDIMGTRPVKSVPLFYEESNRENASRSLGNIHGSSDLNQAYFSPENVDFVQQLIREDVYNRSGKQHIIGKQSEIELKIVMRSIYLQYSKNLQDDIQGQIIELNKLVINACVPKILMNIEQYLGFKKSISSLPVPLPRAQYLSSAGTKSTRMDRFL